MKKLLSVSTAILLLASCAKLERRNAKTAESPKTLSAVTDAPSTDTVEYTHAMAEADADDVVIKTTLGANDLDEELPDSVPDVIPYAKPFLALKNTKRMQFWVDYFTTKQRERFQRFLNNGQEYRHHIEEVLEKHGLPKELYYVGLIESGYYLGARSHAGAQGPWQFIRGTGRRYGLKITPEIDERHDLFKASKAAAKYFKDLHNMFQSWELALAAYNAGENGLVRRILKYGTRDYYKLSKNKQLPSETINYVPKVLAAMHVVANAEKYGFHLPQKAQRLFDMTELKPIKGYVHLATIARKLNIEAPLLKKLNPELKKNHTPRFLAGTYYLRVPKTHYTYKLDDLDNSTLASIQRPESRKELKRRTASVEPSIKRPLSHKVKKGETLSSIAHHYHMSPRELAVANGMRSWRTKVMKGQKLALAIKEKKVAIAVVKETQKPIVYKVRRGDNLSDLARIFDLDVSKMKTVNHLKRGKIAVGQKIILPDTHKGVYTVKYGDHLMKVAREFNQPVEALVKLNSLKRKKIYPGQKIIVDMD